MKELKPKTIWMCPVFHHNETDHAVYAATESEVKRKAHDEMFSYKSYQAALADRWVGLPVKITVPHRVAHSLLLLRIP